MRAAVVGLGALGSEVVRQLALAGAHELLLIDYDRVEQSNVVRDVMYTPDDVGLLKAEALGRRCRERFGQTCFEIANAEIADVGWQRLRDYDVLFGCVDRDSARLEMARIGTRLGVPVCDGGLSGSRGRVSWFYESCFGCRLTGERRRELLRAWRSQPYPCGGGDGLPAATGATNVAAPTAALMVRSAGSGIGARASYSLELRTGASPRIERFDLTQSPECPFHQGAKLGPVPGKFIEALERAREVTWEWPICTAARCGECGAEWRPFVRTARLRSRGRCPACASARVSVLEAVRSVSNRSAWAHLKPQQIGLPEQHLYVARV